MPQSSSNTDPIQYLNLNARELAARFHELSGAIRYRIDKHGGWDKVTGKLSKERYMLDAIGHYRFEDWYKVRNGGKK